MSTLKSVFTKLEFNLLWYPIQVLLEFSILFLFPAKITTNNQIYTREKGDNGLFITLVPKVL